MTNISPFIFIPLKKTEEVNWIQPLRDYIQTSYQTDPEQYSNELKTLQKYRQVPIFYFLFIFIGILIDLFLFFLSFFLVFHFSTISRILEVLEEIQMDVISYIVTQVN